MRTKTLLFILCTAGIQYLAAQTVESIRIGGYIGERINTCIEQRVKTQDVEALVEPFRHREETSLWQSEFFGKWALGAIASYQYTHDEALLELIDNGMKQFIQTQTPDGYIGNYKPEAQLQGWDIWGRKYSSLALLAYYRLTGNKQALETARRLMDHLIAQLKEHNQEIARTGFYRGMPSCSILEPVVYLYRATQDKKYLEFAKSIVTSLEQEGCSQLISKALEGVPVSARSPFPKQWWSYENGQKAYEMMSCYVGLVELGKELNDPLYKEVALLTAADIREHEINIAGSGAAFECWYGGRQRQTQPTYHLMETCVTFTYMQFCERLWEVTGDARYAEEFERTMYNALMASMKDDGSQISKYSPLEGWRHPGEEQCGMHINCCNANAPRGFALIPSMACHATEEQIYINLYLPMTATVTLAHGKEISLQTETDYPVNGKVNINVRTRKPQQFTLALRMPATADSIMAFVNGEQQEILHRGGYLYLNRLWKSDDRIELVFDMPTRIIRQNNMQAVVRGPLVFARDSRFNDGDVDECAVIQCDANGIVQATLTEQTDSSFAWLTLNVPMILGSDLENATNKAVKNIRFCDFASAGNDWQHSSRYRVWIPETLHVMSEPYHSY